MRIKSRRIPGELNVKLRLTIACAIPKKSKFDDIVDKLTQLGVYRIIPLKTERVVVKLDKRKEELRSKRWNRIALSASQQSQRNNIPVVEPVQKFKDVLVRSKDFDLKLIPTLAGQRKSLPEVILSLLPMAKILVLIGPEGDFSDGEIKLALENGFIPVTLGDLVLRVDTAAIAVVSFIRLYGDS
ncbi:MAG: 16S rRNA methyltransferase [Candidatus Omnitrophica bacterium CG23_combo_of_CG06-09_8_20_14_all_41_10]|uniref:16S rRNA (uracil(1498)-N(3))-methyltransferase n=1 Tax=Candidatus Sherwoodlollariibacterium unditelluris TaxID=1974757 RepID=A0A2G9YHY3_9BACT|nr:MAG: 16S rRNA methyltransferase [Candidatus Omnitrophica bacterium CG23_combo_of_CG06-09_8_20_14_all_41_10]